MNPVISNLGFDTGAQAVYGSPNSHEMRFDVAKEKLGTKRVCPETEKKFYDLNKVPIVSPYTGKEYAVSFFEGEPPKAKPAPAKPAEKPVDEESKTESEEKETETEEDEATDDGPEIISLEDAEDEEDNDDDSDDDDEVPDDIADIDVDVDDDDEENSEDSNTFLDTEDESDDLSDVIVTDTGEKNDDT